MNDETQKLKGQIDAILDVAWPLRNRDVERARTLIEEAHTLSTTGEFKESPYHEGQIRSLTGLGYVHRISGDLEQAMRYLTEARQLSEATGLLGSIVYVNLGSLYILLGDLLQSLQAYERGLAAAGQDADFRYEVEALMGIANVYAMRTDYSEAIAYVKQSLELSEESQYLSGQIRALNNLAAIYQNAGDLNNAQTTLERALQLVKDGDSGFETIYLLATAGEIQFALGHYPKALTSLQEALSLSNTTHIVEPAPGILVIMSKVYRELEEIETEIEVLHQAIQVSEALAHYDSQYVCHQRLAEIYESQGDFETALRHHKQFHSIKEMIFNDAADQKLKNMQVLHETETHKQRAEIARLRNVELQQAKDTVEIANRAKSAFLANMSHELRTPINAILGFAQLMQFDPTLSTTNHENLATIVRSGRHLLDLINDVLDISKIEAEKMTVQPSAFNCYQLLDELESTFRFRVNEKELAFRVDCNPNVPKWIKTDERKLRQVLLNLLGNAIKFTAAGRVDLRVYYADGRLHFEVQDTGRGIAEEDLVTLFTPFYQSERQESVDQGTGLGLAISQALVKLMGSDCITVSSELGKGSIFRFDIPVDVASEHSRVQTAPPRRVRALATGQPVYRILVADDYADGRISLVRLLSLIGFDVQEAADGRQAVDMSREWQPHVVFMDLRMPEMDGYEATRRIKLLDPRIVIIAVTSNGFKDERVNDAGFDDFMLKPLQNDLLFETLAQHIGVQFEYEEAADSPSRPILLVEKMRELIRIQPLSWQQRLQHYANAGNKHEILKLVEEIQLSHKELADTIRSLMKEYRFETLISLLEQEVDIESAGRSP